MAASLDQRDQQRWSQQGMRAMAPDAALGVFNALLGSPAAQLAVIDMDWERYCEQSGGPFFSLVCGERAASRQPGRAPAAPRLRLEIEAAAPRARRRLLQDRVREHALKVLGLSASFALDERQGLRAVGLDSLLALELRNRLQADVDAALPATFAFDFPTVADMTRYLADEVLSLGSTPAAAPAQSIASDAVVDELDQMSDEMAEALLNAELSGTRANVVKQS